MKLLYIKDKNSSLSLIDTTLYNCEVIIYDNQTESIQNFVESLFKYKFNGIIISAKFDENYIGLEICLRIRLSRNVLAEKSFCSFFIHSNTSAELSFKDQLFRKQNTTASLFLTPGVFGFSSKEVLQILIQKEKNFNLLNQLNFTEDFLNLIVLKRPDDFGNHSLANIWGVYKLASITGNEDSILRNQKQIKIKDDLYFMLLKAFNSTSESNNKYPKKTIPSKSKNILFIDDEEDKGWSELLSQIFETADFYVVKYSSRFFDDINEEIKKKSADGLPFWDLILLDLRLEKSEDQGENSKKPASEYSGAQILRDIKKINLGIQVIMLTASDKAWNMRELIDIGADGYYTKESPQINLKDNFSLKNFEGFENQVTKCFENEFLKEFFFIINPVQKLLEAEIKKSLKNYNLKFIQKERAEEIYSQILLSEKLIKDYSSELKWGFLNIIIIIEQIIKDSYIDIGLEHIVEKGFDRVTCWEKTGDTIHLSIIPAYKGDKYSIGRYKVSEIEEKIYNNYADRLPFNFRLTCVLHFKCLLPLDSCIFKYYELYTLRSQNVAHTYSKKISFNDLRLAIELLNILIK